MRNVRAAILVLAAFSVLAVPALRNVYRDLGAPPFPPPHQTADLGAPPFPPPHVAIS